MNYYKINTHWFEWRAHSRIEDMKGIPTLNEVTMRQDYEVDWDNLPNNTLPLTLYNFKTQEEDWEELDPFNSDTIPINTGMIEYKGGYPPTAHINNFRGIIVSEKLKKILDEFDLPPHKIINIDLKSCLDLKDVRRYYYLHFEYTLYDLLGYSRCKYQFKSRKTRKVIKEEYGYEVLINNKDDFHNQSNVLAKDNIRIFIIEFHLSKNYSIPDVSQNSFVVDESLYLQIAGLTDKVKGLYGGNKPIKDPIIIPKSD